MRPEIAKVLTVVQAAVWATVGGGVSVIADALDDAIMYEGPPDWIHLRKLFVAGAIAGLIGWWKKNKALYEPIPPSETKPEKAKK